VVRKRELEAWIEARRAEGLWVQPCAAFCGVWFAQERMGRRAVLCERHRCHLYRIYQRHTGRAPPEWLKAKWIEEHGDEPRKRSAGPKIRQVSQILVTEAECGTGIA
jgi:hypothetical protein